MINVQDYLHGYDTGFYDSAVATVVLGGYDVAINGHRYMINYDIDQYRWASVPLTKPYSLTNATNDENTLNNTGGWLRTVEDWSKGAGQARLDADESDPARYSDSLGVNPFTQWQLSLLNTMTNVKSIGTSSGSPQSLTNVGGTVFAVENNGASSKIWRSVSPYSTWNSTALAGAAGTITNNGTVAYLVANSAIYSVTTAGVVALFNNTNLYDLVKFAKGRLMAVNSGAFPNQICEVLGAAAPVYTFTPPGSTSCLITCIEEGDHGIYFATSDSGRSIIYMIPIKADGTSLDVGTAKNRLPDGEIVQAMCSYLGFLIVGTNKGIRVAQVDGSGSLAMGSLINLGIGIATFEPQGQYVWAGMNGNPGRNGVVGTIRLDMNTFNGDTPAWAQDIYPPGMSINAAVTGLISDPFNTNHRILYGNGSGVWVEQSATLASGWLDSGSFTFKVGNDKRLLEITANHSAYPTGFTDVVTVNGTLLGTMAQNGSLSGQSIRSRDFTLRHTLSGNGAASGIVLTRWTAKGLPISTGVQQFILPVQLRRYQESDYGQTDTMDPEAEAAYLVDLWATQTESLLLTAALAETVVVTDYQYIPGYKSENNDSEPGTMILQLTTAR